MWKAHQSLKDPRSMGERFAVRHGSNDRMHLGECVRSFFFKDIGMRLIQLAICIGLIMQSPSEALKAYEEREDEPQAEEK